MLSLEMKHRKFDLYVRSLSKHLLSDCDCTGHNVLEQINQYYSSIVSSLREASLVSIPRKKHGHFKYWWDEELTLLKQQAIRSFQLWSSVGKPRQCVLFDSMMRDKATDKLAIRNKEKTHANEFSDSLNDALISKDLNRFWQSWRSKFGSLKLLLRLLMALMMGRPLQIDLPVCFNSLVYLIPYKDTGN